MSLLLEALSKDEPLVTVELRPPRSTLGSEEGMSAWIDLHHSIGKLARDDVFVFLTDHAVGAAEEESLAHVGGNVGEEVDLRRIVPILTSKHSLEYCQTFATRAVSEGFDTLTVLGGDNSVPPPRCVPHGRDLRELLARREPALTLGGWVNHHRDPREQIGFIRPDHAFAKFALSQIASHHSIDRVRDFLKVAAETDFSKPVVFGVFYYRSANARTLQTLGKFFPVPAAELEREFAAGATPEEICARTIRALRDVGAKHIYVSNLRERRAPRTLREILRRV